MFAEVAREGIDLILTRAPRNAGPAEQERVRTLTEPVRAAGGSVLWVQLTCAAEELYRRVQQEDRRTHSKLTDSDVLVSIYALDAAYPFEPHLRIDTTDLSAAETAAQIAEHFALPILPTSNTDAPLGGTSPV